MFTKINALSSAKKIDARLFVVLMVTTAANSIVASPYRQIASLRPDVPPSYERYGAALAIVDSTIFIGGPEHSTGSVYVYQNDVNGNWTRTANLRSTSSDVFRFGTSISTESSTLLVGAPGKNSPHNAMGAAYVFRRDELGEWRQAAELLASDSLAYRRFGESVWLDSDLALVGAPGAAALPVVGAKTGAAYLFQNDGHDNWTQIAKFTDDESRPDFYANTTYLLEQTVFVEASTGIDVFEKDHNEQWVKMQRIVPSSTSGGIGGEITGSDSTLLVSGSIYINSSYHATVFVFQKDGEGNWREKTQLFPPNFEGSDFGGSLAFDGKTAVIGDPDWQRVYVYQEDENDNWRLIDTLTPDDIRSERFGREVAIRDSLAVVGAPSDGRHNAAYVFQIPEPDTLTVFFIATLTTYANGRRRRQCRLRSC